MYSGDTLSKILKYQKDLVQCIKCIESISRFIILENHFTNYRHVSKESMKIQQKIANQMGVMARCALLNWNQMSEVKMRYSFSAVFSTAKCIKYKIIPFKGL